MKVITKQTEIGLWRYTCPQCGIGDGETGYHAPSHMIYCEVCLEEGQQVKLKRWPTEHGSSPAPSGRPRGG